MKDKIIMELIKAAVLKDIIKTKEEVREMLYFNEDFCNFCGEEYVVMSGSRMKIDCKTIAEEMKQNIARKCQGKDLKFGIVQVGDNQASNAYIKGKMKDCAEVGIEVSLFKYHESISQSSLAEKINFLVRSRTLNGLIIQLPLPPHFNVNGLFE